MSRVEPDGPSPCDLAIVGDSPAQEEVKQGKGFVGASGKMLWPLVQQFTHKTRQDFWVTNLCKEPLDNDASAEAKMTPEHFAACRQELLMELHQVGPKKILAVGALATQALLDDKFTNMRACNGIAFQHAWLSAKVIPCIHPAMTLRGGGEDSLAWTADAVRSLHMAHSRYELSLPSPSILNSVTRTTTFIAIDTEGTPEFPELITWSDGVGRYVVTEPLEFWESITRTGRVGCIIYHNAPWDWAVLEAMGIKDPHKFSYIDTMERAYIYQTVPQGLKDLGYRYFDLKMPSWEQVVMPYYDAKLIEIAETVVRNATTVQTHGKTGKLLKKPKVTVLDQYKPLVRALKSEGPELLRKRAAHLTAPPSLMMHVPQNIVWEYASLDSYVTYHLAKYWSML